MTINQDRGEQEGTIAAIGAVVTMLSIVSDGCGWTVRDEKRIQTGGEEKPAVCADAPPKWGVYIDIH